MSVCSAWRKPLADVSVIIPTYNRREFTCEAVASVLAQPGVAVEVIVADDGSTDGTPEAVRRAFPSGSVQVVECPHAGAPAARNAGLDCATGRYLKFLDSDDALADGSLAAHVAAADAAGATVSYGDFEFFGDLSMQEVGGSPIRHMGRPEDMLVALLNSWWLPPGGYLVRREVFGHIRWDESFARNQDMDYAIGLALAGGDFHHHGAVVVRKRAHRQGRIMDAGALVYGLHCEKIADKTLGALRETQSLTEARRQALADLYWHASRLVYRRDAAAYARLLQKIKGLCPHYAPACRTYAGPRQSVMVNVLGVRLAEAVSRVLGR